MNVISFSYKIFRIPLTGFAHCPLSLALQIVVFDDARKASAPVLPSGSSKISDKHSDLTARLFVTHLSVALTNISELTSLPL